MISTETSRIEKAIKLYETGDYRDARRLAKQVIDDEQAGESEKGEARKILKATGSDPAVIAALIFTLGVFLYLIFRYAL